MVFGTSFLYSGGRDVMEVEGVVSSVIGDRGVSERRWGMVIGDAKCIWGLLQWFGIGISVAIGRVEW